MKFNDFRRKPVFFYFKNMVLTYLFLLFFALSLPYTFGQINIPGSMSIAESGNEYLNIPFIFDDFSLIAGGNTAGLYWSNNYKDLSYSAGYNLGIQAYFPLNRIAFFNYGVLFSQRNFSYSDANIKYRNHFIDIPLFFSYTLPVLQNYDCRFLLGTQISYRTSSDQIGEYSSLILDDPDYFKYDIGQFRKWDYGWTFGVSAEFNHFYLRLRSFVGLNKLMNTEQGSMNSFNIDVGYFIIRSLRK